MPQQNQTSTIRKLSISLAVLGIIAFIVCIYLFFWVARQENKLNESSFRVLRHIEKKLDDRIYDYRKLLIGKLSKCKDCFDDSIHLDSNIRNELKKEGIFSLDSVGLSFDAIAEEWGLNNNRIYFRLTQRDDARMKAATALFISIDFNKILII